jgi:hypothetical protein
MEKDPLDIFKDYICFLQNLIEKKKYEKSNIYYKIILFRIKNIF